MDGETIAMIVGAMTLLGTLVARWSETNPKKHWLIRIGRVLDPTQVIDSTRKLSDD
jgi:hypothetical protein